MIVGGWTFIWWAFGITWTALLGYSISLALRCRQAEHDLGAMGGGVEEKLDG